ncbi:hypothetical protein [Parasediminibacterium sp. JCM 36343]|uniref:hypothetical protein n=1 Tax=Parasediminibacterium sp. JCM 36343 TaxID=3374279 RepID=UPI00397DF646
MRKVWMASAVLTTFALSILLFESTSCNKTTAQQTVIRDTIVVRDTVIPATCDIRGTYYATGTSVTGASSSSNYILKDNNFVVSSATSSATSPTVTFGGYRNTCDSVFLSLYSTSNSCYYLLKGKLINNGKTVSGTFQNLTTTSDYGTFIMSR